MVDYKTQIYIKENCFNKKNFSGNAQYFLHFVWKKSTFLAVGGSTPPPDRGHANVQNKLYTINP